MSRCPGCNGPMTPHTHGGPPKIYCTKACGARARDRAKAKRRKLLGAVEIIPSKRSFASFYREALTAGLDPLEERDAVYECPHGRMPGYTGTACTCWQTTVEATA